MTSIRSEQTNEVYHSESEFHPNEQEGNVIHPVNQDNRQAREEEREGDQADDVRFFSTEEVGDLLRSRKNLIYMFRLSGELTRFLLATRQDVYLDLLKRRLGQQKMPHESLPDRQNTRNPKNPRN